ncbi:MAG TPA: hypothetical protein VGS08_03335 [Candidatus Saccharimonadales bacterium]|nr:hypothetical protein [Candidatus Saccharimonadales bacterium]
MSEASANQFLALGDFSRQDFIHGNPESLIQAEDHPKVLVLWPHGDETLGPDVGYHIYTERSELLTHVDYMCGNPLAANHQPALRHTVGITDGYEAEGTDLNRSFTPGVPPKSYEQHRAPLIMATIEQGGYDYVLDLHTTFTPGGRYFLISERFIAEPAVRAMIAASPINRVVVMPDKIARDGLIGNCDRSVSIEYSRPLAGRTGVRDTMMLIDGLVSGQSAVSPHKRELFYVTNVIPKDNDPGLEARNFQLCKDGYYPILFGEKGYRDDPTKKYLGFAATTKEIITL